MGYIVEDFNPHDMAEEIIEYIVNKITDNKVSDDDILVIMKDIRKYSSTVAKVVNEKRRNMG